MNDADLTNNPVLAQTGGETQNNDETLTSGETQGDGAMIAALQATSAFAGGSGTQNDPYQIETAERLAMVADDLGASYVLNSDIVLSDSWTPIGEFRVSEGNSEAPDEDFAFHGSFDGNNHQISELTAGGEAAACVGLFGVTANATVKALTLKDAEVTGHTMTAAAIGYAYNTTVDNVDLTGTSTVDGKMYVGQSTAGSNASNMVAGIVGAGMDAIILNRDVSGATLTMEGVSGATFSGGNVHDAGLVGGGMEGCTLEGCTVTGGSVIVPAAENTALASAACPAVPLKRSILRTAP